MEYPKILIEPMTLDENHYNDGFERWSVLKLIEQSKLYEVFEMPLAGIPLGNRAWGGKMSYDIFVHHCKRLDDSDLSYPIILDSQGHVADGWHRICKAVLEGKTTIKAIRLQKMPVPDRSCEK